MPELRSTIMREITQAMLSLAPAIKRKQLAKIYPDDYEIREFTRRLCCLTACASINEGCLTHEETIVAKAFERVSSCELEASIEPEHRLHVLEKYHRQVSAWSIHQAPQSILQQPPEQWERNTDQILVRCDANYKNLIDNATPRHLNLTGPAPERKLYNRDLYHGDSSWSWPIDKIINLDFAGTAFMIRDKTYLFFLSVTADMPTPQVSCDG
jgi:hypothetical protein